MDVERSFSMYKNVLANNRRSFLFENLRMILQCTVIMQKIRNIVVFFCVINKRLKFLILIFLFLRAFFKEIKVILNGHFSLFLGH